MTVGGEPTNDPFDQATQAALRAEVDTALEGCSELDVPEPGIVDLAAITMLMAKGVESGEAAALIAHARAIWHYVQARAVGYSPA